MWFAARFELPEGGPVVLEPHLLLIAWEIFKDGRVEVLALLPKGNGKTTLFALLAVFHLLTVRNAQCYIAAADSEQATEMYRFAHHFVMSKPEVAPLVKVLESTKRIKSRRDQGFIRVLASDDSKLGGKNQGYNPTLALIDELHAHEKDNLYVDMRSGVFKRGGLCLNVTTAGSDEESLLGNLRAGMLAFPNVRRGMVIDRAGRLAEHADGRLTVAEAASGRTLMLEWACTKDDDLDDPAVVKLANPASWVTPASIEDAREAPGITPGQFARYRANVWAQADDAKIEDAVWDGLCEPGAAIPVGERIWVVIDYARKSDATAVTRVWRRPDGRALAQSHVWALEVKGAGRVQPACHELIRGERVIRQSLIRDHVRGIRDDGFRVAGVLYDPHLFDPEELGDEGFLMIEFPQTDSRMVPASKDFYEAVCQGQVVHDGDPVLRAHVTAAAAKDKGAEDAWRFSKAASKKRIDALITLVMGVPHALREPVGTGGFEW